MQKRIQLSDHFTTGRLLLFVAPSIVMMIFTSIYSVVDGLFVSNFAGKDPFAALNLIYPYIQAFGCLGFMLGTGGSALVAMTVGLGDRDKANRLFSMLTLATVLLGGIATVLALALLRPAAILLGAEGELLELAVLYGAICLAFQIAFMLQYFFQSFLIMAEKPRLGLLFTISAGCTNMVLDFVFVGLWDWGLAGAAGATVLSQVVGGIGPALYFMRPDNGSLLHFVRPQRADWRLLGQACANGSSELMSNLSNSLVSALYNWQLLRLAGTDGVAAYGVIMYLSFIFAAVFIGYAQGSAPIVSYHYGAAHADELHNLLRKSLGLVAAGGIAMLAAAEALAGPLARIFVGYDAGLMDLTTSALRLYALSYLLCGFNIWGSAFFTALNDGVTSAALSFLRTLLFQVAAVLLLPLVLGTAGIWLSITVAECAALLMLAGFLAAKRSTYHYF